jgi:Uri superfamily endonuclease
MLDMRSERSNRPLRKALSRADGEWESGHYALLLRLTAPVHLQIGALGSFTFPAGWYVYTGSALRNLQARLQRHFRPEKKLRWHIDYLTSHKACHTIGAVVVPAADPDDEIEPEALTVGGASVPAREHAEECAVNRLVIATLGAVHPCRGFGASDCRARCRSHLCYRQAPVSLLEIARTINGEVILPPGIFDPGGEDDA